MGDVINLGIWDLILVLSVSAQATVIAYVYEPKWKALVLNLPIPFTFAVLAVGRQVDITNILGLFLLFCFFHVVRYLHYNLSVTIIAAIITSALGYCATGSALARILPRTNVSFWITAILILTLAYLLYRTGSYRAEPGHRTPLPIWIKLPIIALVIFFLVSIKAYMQGFMTIFPMVGVISAYEARHSLWTICRQIPVVMLTLAPLMIVCRVTQSSIGLVMGLSVGWVAFLAVFLPVTYSMWTNDKKQFLQNMEEI
ncbi:MAG: hypothetical protein JSV03_17100 [Planctomycetota bacterium]|nr:MAG: hypothetical protein JSV03_17100 [Planctomycetota bacterium]